VATAEKKSMVALRSSDRSGLPANPRLEQTGGRPTRHAGALLAAGRSSFKRSPTTIMRASLDNTGVHSAYRCVRRCANSEEDLRGLFQFATFLVFADGLVVNGFEPDEINATTCEMRQALIKLGLESESFEIVDRTILEYQEACEAAALACASDIDWAFNPLEGHIPGLMPDLPPGAETILESFATLVTEEYSPENLEAIRLAALEEKAGGACHYMIASCEPLRERVRVRARRESWGHPSLLQLNAFLRYYLNDELARQREATYAPATGRARVMRHRNRLLAERLASVVSSVVGNGLEKPLPIPSVASVLVAKAKGDPLGILSEAIELRHHSANRRLRDWIRKRVGESCADSLGDLASAEGLAQEAEDLVRKALALVGKPTLLGAIEVQLVLGMLPVVTVQTEKLVEWFHYRKGCRKVALLTELSRLAKITMDDTAAYNRLLYTAKGGGEQKPAAGV